jgi:Anti-sigma factor NepR
VHRPSREEARQRSAAVAEVRVAIGRGLRKMYECEQAQPLPDRFARLLSGFVGDGTCARERDHGSGGADVS